MVRIAFLFLLIFGLAAALIFGYRQISKSDVKIAGKLVFAGIISLVLTTIIYLGEYS